jgi:peptidoglycan/LPS O-acetylase OafA/YrhL
LRNGVSYRALCVLTALAYVASCLERVVMLHRAGTVTTWMFFGTDARGGTLFLGCFLALLVSGNLVPQWVRKMAAPAAILGLAYLAYAFIGTRYRFAPHRAFTEGLTGVGLATALVVLGVVVAPRILPARVLAFQPVVWIGKVSYGLYLWHVPIDVAIRPGMHDLGLSWWPLQLLRLVVTFAVVTVSYYVVEQPIRHGAWPWTRWTRQPVTSA